MCLFYTFRYLHANRLNGQIPSTIGQLTALTWLCVVALPFRLFIVGDAHHCCLAFRQLFNNQLTGEIPESFAQLTNLKRL